MSREIITHKGSLLNDAIHVAAIDDAGPGGANRRYKVGVPFRNPVERYPAENSRLSRTHADLNFQDGDPSAEINGISNEALLAVLIDRMQGFQRGPFACRENAIVLTKLEEAMLWLQKRTRERESRGVEGKLEK